MKYTKKSIKSKEKLYYFFFYLFVYWEWLCVWHIYEWRSVDNFEERVLSFHYEDPKDELNAVKLGC